MKENDAFDFFRDDGSGINPNLIRKPSLCVSCRKDDDPQEEILCTLTRTDQQGDEEFRCEAFEPRRQRTGTED
jgi:hypothetical protein